MKYRELFTLNPIQTTIKIAQADQDAGAKRLVSTFRITPSLAAEIDNVAIPLLDPNGIGEGKGIFVVGNYGTGKSHLMSFLSVVAENGEALEWIRQDEWRKKLGKIAGKYKVRRHEINVPDPASMTLYDVVAGELSHLGRHNGVNFEFAPASKVANVKDELAKFMAAFESKHPDTGVLLVTDEVLDHLRRLNDTQMVRDLGTLRALGEFADGSRLKFMAGVQQSLFNNDRFNHVAEEIKRIRQRYSDFVIDSTGVEQLIETYLFEKNESQRAKIKEYLLKHKGLFEILGNEIDRCVKLFPAHPRFISEFERVTVVERREILKVLTAEGTAIQDVTTDETVPRLITSDLYWHHIERDKGLDANADIREIKQDVAVLKGRIESSFAPEDRQPAVRLVEALGVNRLTTTAMREQIGLTPHDLKENLLWYTKIPMPDPTFLTQQARKTLDKTREAAAGQFLAKSATSDHFYIDPTLNRDYEQEVLSEAKTIAPHVVQRYLNEIITRALEIDNTKPVAENRLWNYELEWVDKNTERPGWLFFGFPNLRNTAQPPKDFYVFICPSKRIDVHSESIADTADECYWFLEGFPSAKFEEGSSQDGPDTWLDLLRQYAAARERASRVTNKPNELAALNGVADRLLKDMLPEFNRNSNDWVTVQFKTDKKTLGAWIQDMDPGNVNAAFKTKFRSLSQWMFSAEFAQKYPDYPVFSMPQTEQVRLQNARIAMEMLAGIGLGIRGTDQGRCVLEALGLYQAGKPTIDQSIWIADIRRRLAAIKDGQFLNASDLFEEKDGRLWLRGQSLEAEWAMVVLTAGVVEGDLVIVGKGNNHYDPSKLEDLFSAIREPQDIVRVTKPKTKPLDEWKRLFDIVGLPKGELAHESKHDGAITKFVNACNNRIETLVRLQEAYKTAPQFASEDSAAALAESAKSLVVVKDQLESLKTLNSRAKMSNLKLGLTEIDELGRQLKLCDELGEIQKFRDDNEMILGAVGRYETILAGKAPAFEAALEQLKVTLNDVYKAPESLGDRRTSLESDLNAAKTQALIAYQSLHKKHRLDAEGAKRKGILISSPEMKRLNALANIQSLGGGALEEVHRKLEKLVNYKPVSDEQLLKSPTSLHPSDPFDPSRELGDASANEVLAECEQALMDLHEAWKQCLLKDLGSDPSIRAGFAALKDGERKMLDAFVAKKEFPETIDGSFVVAVNQLLHGLRRKPVKRDAFSKAIFGDGVPLTPDELRQRVEDWIKEQTANEDATQVRFALEE